MVPDLCPPHLCPESQSLHYSLLKALQAIKAELQFDVFPVITLTHDGLVLKQVKSTKFRMYGSQNKANIYIKKDLKQMSVA